jgi:hypothetical protein
VLRRSPKGTPIVVAGEPEGCSGKANTIVTGMDVATHDLVVWTDDDFYHPSDWLDQLRADYEQQGPTTEIPLFVGRDPLEPVYAQVSVFIATPAGDCGGALMFDPTEEALLAELRQTTSDDVTVNGYIEFQPHSGPAAPRWVARSVRRWNCTPASRGPPGDTAANAVVSPGRS